MHASTKQLVSEPTSCRAKGLQAAVGENWCKEHGRWHRKNAQIFHQTIWCHMVISPNGNNGWKLKSMSTRDRILKGVKTKARKTMKRMHNLWVALKKKISYKKCQGRSGKIWKEMATSTISQCLANNTLWELLWLTNVVEILDMLESNRNCWQVRLQLAYGWVQWADQRVGSIRGKGRRVRQSFAFVHD